MYAIYIRVYVCECMCHKEERKDLIGIIKHGTNTNSRHKLQRKNLEKYLRIRKVFEQKFYEIK